MIDLVVRSFLGKGGGLLLDYYLENGLIINGIIILYFAFLLIGRRTYSTSLTYLVSWIQERPEAAGKEVKQIRSLIKKMDLPWNEALKSSMFPLIARPGGWLLYPKTKQQLIKIFPLEVLAEKIEE